MANLRLDQLPSSATTPADTDIFPTVENVATTHDHKRKTWATIMSAVGAWGGTYTNKTIASPVSYSGLTDLWISANETWTYASSTTITVPSNATLKYSIGDRIMWTANSVVLYAYVVGVTSTLLTVLGNAVTNYTITNNFYSKKVSPKNFPAYFSYTPTITAGSGTFTSVSATGTYQMNARLIHVVVTVTITTNGTAATYILATLPISCPYICIITGREVTSTGNQQEGYITGTNLYIYNYDTTYSGATGRTILMSGYYVI
jgi:hypothetical protein